MTIINIQFLFIHGYICAYYIQYLINLLCVLMFFGQIKWRFAFCGKCEASVKLMRGGILYRLNTRTNYIRMNILRFTLNQLCSVLMNGWLGLYETTVYYGSEYTANPIDSIDGGTSTQPFLIGVLHARCI